MCTHTCTPVPSTGQSLSALCRSPNAAKKIAAFAQIGGGRCIGRGSSGFSPCCYVLGDYTKSMKVWVEGERLAGFNAKMQKSWKTAAHKYPVGWRWKRKSLEGKAALRQTHTNIPFIPNGKEYWSGRILRRFGKGVRLAQKVQWCRSRKKCRTVSGRRSTARGKSLCRGRGGGAVAEMSSLPLLIAVCWQLMAHLCRSYHELRGSAVCCVQHGHLRRSSGSWCQGFGDCKFGFRHLSVPPVNSSGN